MKTIVLIACSGTKKKCDGPIPAEELYTGSLFKKSLEYAKLIEADKIFILSAKHHLVELNQPLEYYDCYLATFKEQQKKEWSDTVIKQLESKTDLSGDKFVILAGKDYRKHLLGKIKCYELPLEGLGIGQQQHKLIDLINALKN